MRAILVPDAAAINAWVMSTAGTCCDVILTVVAGLVRVEVGGLGLAVGRNGTLLSARGRAIGSSCDGDITYFSSYVREYHPRLRR
jgi:hypothetical protein